jgi:CRP-like cAMP-binding protein
MAEPSTEIAPFLRAVAEASPEREVLMLRQWAPGDWQVFFSYAHRVAVPRSKVLIQADASERVIYFVASGLLEVTSVLSSQSLGTIAKVHPGSVVGELSFFDGLPRSAKVWAVADSELYRLDFTDFQRYADTHPRQACDLLMAIGCVIASRLRRTQARVMR